MSILSIGFVSETTEFYINFKCNIDFLENDLSCICEVTFGVVNI